MIYAELRRLARSHLRRERREHTLQATALVHECYIRLAGRDAPNWESRAHFLGIASQQMRQILVDHSRRRQALKRGGNTPKEAVDDQVAANQRSREVLALDDAMSALEAVDPRKSRMVELRYFGGLTGQEIACVLGLSTATVTREMRMAEAWLARELKADRNDA